MIFLTCSMFTCVLKEKESKSLKVHVQTDIVMTELQYILNRKN